MLKAEETKISKKLSLIDTVERLGVAYHFGKDIEEQLEQIFKLDSDFQDSEDFDLFTAALQFRLFRQHGYEINYSVFDRFKDANNAWKETLESDIVGLLSLHEATHLRMHGEEILGEAFAFSNYHLKSVIPQLETPLLEKVVRALEQSLHRGVPRVEAREYISYYEKEETKIEPLLRLAVLDFNTLQRLYKKELSNLSRWWKEVDLKSKLPYFRDRLVECYFWAMALFFEPEYSIARSVLTKAIAILGLLDDTYDSYASLEELESFTEALQRTFLHRRSLGVALSETSSTMLMIVAPKGLRDLLIERKTGKFGSGIADSDIHH